MFNSYSYFRNPFVCNLFLFRDWAVLAFLFRHDNPRCRRSVAQAMQPQFAQLKNRPLGTAELNMWLQSMAKAKPMQKLC